MKPGYYRLIGQTPVPCTMREWAEQFEDIDVRRVLLTGIGPFEVSTVFLGMDHNWSRQGPPILFETMSFTGPHVEVDNPHDGRDATWAEAEVRHRAAVAWLKEHCAPHEEPRDLTAPLS